jgi:benzoylsuccinyl-CoA thiolase BbsB subunit
MTPFGKHPNRTSTDLGAEAVLAALRDSGIDPRRIGAAYCGTVFEGMSIGQRVLAHVGLVGFPITNVENACASGSTAVREASLAVRAGEHEVVLALGVEHPTSTFNGALTPGESDLETSVGLTMPGIYALRAQRYMEEYGATREELAQVSVKNRRHAAANPYAYFREAVTTEQVLASRPIADPLVLLECSPATDGAAAALIVSESVAREFPNRVELAASTLRSGEVESVDADMSFETLTQQTAGEAYERAGIGPDDIDVAEVHDCFSIAEALRVEGAGLFPRGEYLTALARGEASIGGRLPINPSGGLLGKGHPLGATGVAQVVEIVRQLRGEAGDRQVSGAAWDWRIAVAARPQAWKPPHARCRSSSSDVS